MGKSYKKGHPKKGAFLAAFAETGTIKAACEVSEVGRQTHYNWLSSDPEYAEAFKEAGQKACEALENEARRRAVTGLDRPVYQGGKKVGTVREYSDTLLIFLMKGAMPNKYRERVEHSGPGGGPVNFEVGINARIEHELERLAATRKAANALPPPGIERTNGHS